MTDEILTPPPQELYVHYAKSNKTAHLGNEVTPMQTKHKPIIEYNADKHSHYTIMITDPDSPSRANRTIQSWISWLVINIPGNDIQSGEEVAMYTGTGPGLGIGLHRYVMLLFKQKGAVKLEEVYTTPAERILFSVERFAKKYDLGAAIAGNFILSQYDESVPELHKKIGFA